MEGVFQPDFICYGIPVGSKSYVKHHLSLKVQEVTREVGEVLTTLGRPSGRWPGSSPLMKLDYHISLCYPSDMAEAARPTAVEHGGEGHKPLHPPGGGG